MSTVPSPPSSERPLIPARIIIAMGVSSSGKTSVGKALARRLHAPFLDGDGYHSDANKEKMRSGVPLVDEDRWPWLRAHARALREAADAKGVVVGASSALRRSYRDYLTAEAGEPILFILLHGPKELIAERIAKRQHDYMPASLLDSQFATLELPDPDENVLTLAIDDPIETLADRAAKAVRHIKSFRRGQ